MRVERVAVKILKWEMAFGKQQKAMKSENEKPTHGE
jgi:hypothetical protein